MGEYLCRLPLLRWCRRPVWLCCISNPDWLWQCFLFHVSPRCNNPFWWREMVVYLSLDQTWHDISIISHSISTTEWLSVQTSLPGRWAAWLKNTSQPGFVQGLILGGRACQSSSPFSQNTKHSRCFALPPNVFFLFFCFSGQRGWARVLVWIGPGRRLRFA